MKASDNLPVFPADPAVPPAGGWPHQPNPDEMWSPKKILFLIAMAVFLQIACIFAFGTKKQMVPRSVINVPRVQLANRADELVALDNPALFALPNPRDFSSAVWQQPPSNQPPSFRYAEAPRWLPLAAGKLGAAFSYFMQTNRFGELPLDFKPPPQFAELISSPGSNLPQSSTLTISGDLASRPLLAQPGLPSLEWNDIIAPSKVQILVDQTGNVISAVLLPADNPAEAAGRSPKGDTNAIVLARSLKFAPAPQLAFGEITFFWHTLPLLSTNLTLKP